MDSSDGRSQECLLFLTRRYVQDFYRLNKSGMTIFMRNILKENKVTLGVSSA